MKKVADLLVGLFVLAAIGLVGYGIFLVLSAFAKKIPEISFSVDITLITATVAGFLGIIAVLVKSYYDKKHVAEVSLRVEKTKLYDKYVKFMFDFVASNNENIRNALGIKQMTEKELLQFQTEFVPPVVMWGSDTVLRKFSDYMQFIYSSSHQENAKSSTHSKELLQRQEDLMYAMRKDLGHKNKRLGRGGIWNIYITDYSTWIRPAS